MRHFKQVKTLEEICVNFAKLQINQSNCIIIATLAERCNLPELEREVFKFCSDKFLAVSQTPDFVALEADYLDRIISHNELNTQGEIHVFNAIMNWVQADQETRIEHLERLLKKVRFALIRLADLRELNRSELVRNFPICGQLISDAEDFLIWQNDHQYIERNSDKIRLFRTPPRPSEKGRIYAVGGSVLLWSTSTASAEVYDLNTDSWEEIAPMAEKQRSVGLTAFGDSIYAVAKIPDPRDSTQIERYDVRAKKWFKDVVRLNTRRSYFGFVTFDRFIYVIGGLGVKGASNRMERYDRLTNTWSDCARMSQKRFYMGVAVYEHYIYVMGGSEWLPLDSVERYNCKTNSWKSLAPMKYRRSNLGACACRGRIFAVGGNDEQGEHDSGEYYNPAMNQWTEIKRMSVKRSGLGLVELAGQVFAIGGGYLEDHGYVEECLNDVESFDIETNQWTRRQPMKHKRWGAGVAVQLR